MNVILFTDSPVFAGTERHILDLACGLRSLAVPVRIACPRPGAALADRAAAAGIALLPIPKRGLIDRRAIRILAAELRCGRADVVHAHNGRTHLAAAFAVRRAGRGACIATQHFLAPTRTTRTGIRAWLAGMLHRRAARNTAHLIAISHAVRDAAIARHDMPPDRITTVLNGAASPDLSGAPSPEATRATLGLQPDAPFLFCAARLETEKDLPTLLSALPLVLEQHPAARCLIAGEGGRRPALQQQIAALRLQRHAALLGFRQDIPALLQACDLFVLPSAAEPFGLVLLEAMALAKPVVAMRAGGPAEIVLHGQTGLLADPRDPRALAQAINTLLADPNLRRAFGAAGRQRYLSHFTIDRMARDTLAIYRHLAPLDVLQKGTHDH